MTSEKSELKNKDECIFCTKFSESDDDHNLIVKRYQHCAVVLNAYPYNAGHLLVLPFEHKAELSELSEQTRAEIMEVTTEFIDTLKTDLNADGVNAGINLGAAAGGSLSSHLHFHIIPRWHGDTNFLATVGDTKTVCTSFEDILGLFRNKLSDRS